MVNFVMHDGISDEFHHHVMAVFAQFPEGPVKALEENGWTFHLVRNAVESGNDLDRVDQPTSMGLAAVPESGPKHIYIYQRNIVPYTQIINEDQWITADILAHELGHAFDRFHGEQTGTRLSESAEFIQAHNDDVGLMREYERDENNYFVEVVRATDPKARARSEAVAELFSLQLLEKRPLNDEFSCASSVPGQASERTFGQMFNRCAEQVWTKVTAPVLGLRKPPAP